MYVCIMKFSSNYTREYIISYTTKTKANPEIILSKTAALIKIRMETILAFNYDICYQS